jgi:hypothetical protein
MNFLKIRSGAIAHTCNPSYSGGRDWEDQGSRPTWIKKFKRPYLHFCKLDMVAHSCHPSCAGSIHGRIAVQTSLGINLRPYLNNT